MKTKIASGLMLTLLAISMLTLAFNIQQVKAEPTTIIIPDDYEKIQWAIGNASDGDTIFVRAGTYYENIIINKNNLTLVGENRENTIIDGGGKDVAVYVSASLSNVNIGGFTIKNGIELNGLSNNLESNIITNSSCGIDLYGSGHVVRNNTVKYNHVGIVTITDNHIIQGNTLTNNNEGIYLDDCTNNTIQGNTITRNDWGIKLRLPRNTTIEGNTITHNGYGVWLFYGINFIYHNNFINNTIQVHSYESINAWDDGYPSGGNYWSDYEERYPDAEELDDSSIWDTPYVIDENNQDRYPLMNPLLAPPLSYNLTIYSSPTGVTFTINGIPETTPYTEWLLEGFYTLVMPETHNGYVWSHWLEDGDNNRIKTVTIDTNITLTAVFTAPPLPLWMQWWFYAIVAVVIVALVGAVYFLKKRKQPTPTAPSLPPEGTETSIE